MPLGPMIRQLSPGPKLRLMSLSRRRLPSGVYTSACSKEMPAEGCADKTSHCCSSRTR